MEQRLALKTTQILTAGKISGVCSFNLKVKKKINVIFLTDPLILVGLGQFSQYIRHQSHHRLLHFDFDHCFYSENVDG